LNRFDDAVADASAAIELGYDHVDVLANMYHNRADAYVKLGRGDLARADLGKSVALATGSETGFDVRQSAQDHLDSLHANEETIEERDTCIR
jgi:hypothetical protein